MAHDDPARPLGESAAQHGGCILAGIGGADAITVLPFTTALGLPDTFARRIGRNTQLVLLEEAHLWRVADPSTGADSLEALTEALCHQDWRLFQELEREGGIVGSLGELQTRIAITRAAREHAIATRRHTGTSEFPDDVSPRQYAPFIVMRTGSAKQGPEPEAAEKPPTSWSDREKVMPIFISQGRYSQEAMRGMLQTP